MNRWSVWSLLGGALLIFWFLVGFVLMALVLR